MARIVAAARISERSDAVANRQRILDAAREVFAHRGLNAEMKEIAERAGVGVGTLYRHFESREGLLAALVQQAEEDLLRRLQRAARNPDPSAALRAFIRAGAEACQQFGVLTEEMLAEKCEIPKRNKPSGTHTKFTHLLAELLDHGIRQGAFRADLDVSVAIAALESMFTSGMLLDLAARRSYSQAADAVAEFFLKAVAAPARG